MLERLWSGGPCGPLGEGLCWLLGERLCWLLGERLCWLLGLCWVLEGLQKVVDPTLPVRCEAGTLIDRRLVQPDHRLTRVLKEGKRINTEEKAKVVAAALGTEFIPFLAAIAILCFWTI